MEFFDVIRSRRSVRVFDTREVEPEKLAAVLETLNTAPSAGNLQAYEVFAITRRPCRTALARAALWQDFLAQAPIVLVFCACPARSSGRYGQRGLALYCIQDATIACAYAMLAAAALGLASVWIGAFRDDEVRAALGIGSDLRPVAILPIGYAAESPEQTPRRPLSELIRWVQ